LVGLEKGCDMKILVVAHPDDEILFFNPMEFDRIIIVFLHRPFNDIGNKREKAMQEHPLKDKITCLGIVESGYRQDKDRKMIYKKTCKNVIEKLKLIKADGVTTHNAQGEYGHQDHKLIFEACMQSFDCLVNGMSPNVYRQIQKVYKDNECWTWDL